MYTDVGRWCRTGTGRIERRSRRLRYAVDDGDDAGTGRRDERPTGGDDGGRSLVERLGASVRRVLLGGGDDRSGAHEGNDGRDGGESDRPDEDAAPTKPSHRGDDGEVRWTFAVGGEATRASEQLAEVASVVEGTLSALGDVFRPTSCTVALAGVDGDGPIRRVLPWGDGFRSPADTGTYRWSVPGDRTSRWLADLVRGSSLSGEIPVCLRVDVDGEARVDGWRPDVLSAAVNPVPAGPDAPGDAAYRVQIAADGATWLATDGRRRKLERAFDRLRGRFAVREATTDGDDRAAALLE
jgi:hypothetical protein